MADDGKTPWVPVVASLVTGVITLAGIFLTNGFSFLVKRKDKQTERKQDQRGKLEAAYETVERIRHECGRVGLSLTIALQNGQNPEHPSLPIEAVSKLAMLIGVHGEQLTKVHSAFEHAYQGFSDCITKAVLHSEIAPPDVAVETRRQLIPIFARLHDSALALKSGIINTIKDLY